MKIIFLIVIAINVLKLALGKCRMKQDCDVRKPDCKPSAANNTEPQILTGMQIICPEYLGKPACCNEGQNILMRNNFDSLDSIFGTKYGGCDVCAINLKRLWCHFSCSTDQDKFMNISGYQDFTIDNVNFTLLMIDMSLNQKMNCELFNSCKKTKYASQVVAMGNAIGFTTFQGTEAYRKSPVFINFTYVKEGGLEYPIDTCDTQPVNATLRGFPFFETCKCNSCDKSCHYSNELSLPILEGFSVLFVGLFYLAVFLFTLIIYSCKSYYRKVNPHDHSRSSSLNSHHQLDAINPNGSHSNKTNSNLNISDHLFQMN